MNILIKQLTKYWVYISIVFTILSSIVTGGWYLKGKIDQSSDTLIETKITVRSNTVDVKALHDAVLILQEDERIRELKESK